MNTKRVLIGAVAGGVTWLIWSCIVHMGILATAYTSEEAAGALFKEPRYGFAFFFASWVIVIFLLAGVAAWLYAATRGSLGAGPRTALKVGALVGFAAGLPVNSYIVTWVPLMRRIPFWWMLDMWVGAILATLVAGLLYKDE